MKSSLITTEAAAEILGGLKPNTLEGWRIRGVGPRFVKIGRLVRYRADDLDAWIESQSRVSTSQRKAR